jgi:hypothetical protein
MTRRVAARTEVGRSRGDHDEVILTALSRGEMTGCEITKDCESCDGSVSAPGSTRAAPSYCVVSCMSVPRK